MALIRWNPGTELMNLHQIALGQDVKGDEA